MNVPTYSFCDTNEIFAHVIVEHTATQYVCCGGKTISKQHVSFGSNPMHMPNAMYNLPLCARAFFTCILYCKKLYLFAGKHAQSEIILDDVVVLDIDTNTTSSLPTSGTAPSSRFGHVAVCYQNVKFVHGGYCHGAASNELYMLDLQSNKWTHVNIELPALYHHTAVLYQHYMILYGGKSNNYINSHVYAIDLQTMQVICKTVKQVLEPRFGHAAAVHEHFMFVYGGCNDEEQFDTGGSLNLQDYLYNADSVAWEQWKPNVIVKYPVFGCLIKCSSGLIIHGGTKVIQTKNKKVVENVTSATSLVDDVWHLILSFLTVKQYNNLIAASKIYPLCTLASCMFF